MEVDKRINNQHMLFSFREPGTEKKVKYSGWFMEVAKKREHILV